MNLIGQCLLGAGLLMLGVLLLVGGRERTSPSRATARRESERFFRRTR
jgi:hypothetical protein